MSILDSKNKYRVKIIASNKLKKEGQNINFQLVMDTDNVKLFDNEYSFDIIEDYKKTVRYQIENFIKN